MAAAMELVIAKKKLLEVLKDDWKLYINNLQSWFKQKLSREDFDAKARRILPPECTHLHNQFLLAILTRCQTFSTTLSPRDLNHHSSKSQSSKRQRLKKKHSTRSNFQQRFVPQNPLNQAPHIVPRQPDEEPTLNYCTKDHTLPDIAMIHGRMIVSAWDYGLEDVENDAVHMVLCAVEQQLKNVISSVISRRAGFKTREGRFKYSMGSQPTDPYQRTSQHLHDYTTESQATDICAKGSHGPSIKPSPATADMDAAFQLACSGAKGPLRTPITLFDLFDALKASKSTIASHSVYSINMERIVNRLWHPSNEELEQDVIFREQLALKQSSQSGTRL
ncbi:unnamed protein product [Owenia fusiformis]|uniref:Transcriptional adapter 1-like protein n=1 Tax=Owenia fusiformis TaxID=6347 RepID=A0A8J1U4G2_OWEFU|nr:unnamed protein product [Owenia fusiformis]